MSEPNPFLIERMRPHQSTIFAEMSALAEATGSINLGQGFPDVDGPETIKRAAIEAILAGANQYPPGMGRLELREAVAHHQHRRYGLEFDPGSEILVTAGATEGIAATLLALCRPGDEVVVFEPYYDSYVAVIDLAGATRRVVTLRSPDWSFTADDLDRAISHRTRAVLVNSPHNPTGKVFSREELELVASRCIEHDLLAVTDEVYEHLVFDGEHVPLATIPGMADRTITISSAGKTFSFTGWKIGWVCANPELVGAVRAVKQFLTYSGGGPFQLAMAHALNQGDELIDDLVVDLRRKRDLFSAGLRRIGFEVIEPAGTYFVTTDVSSLGFDDGEAFCWALPERCGVVAVPSAVFYDDKAAGASLVRWTFCKRVELLEEALGRLQKLL